MNWEIALRRIMLQRGYSPEEINEVVSKIRGNARAMSYVTCMAGVATTLTAVPRIAPLIAIQPEVAVVLALGAGGWILLSSPACAVVREDLRAHITELEQSIDAVLQQNASNPG